MFIEQTRVAGDYLEGGVRVPAILSFPTKVPQGETRDPTVPVLDRAPTVLDFCGIELAPTPRKSTVTA